MSLLSIKKPSIIFKVSSLPNLGELKRYKSQKSSKRSTTFDTKWSFDNLNLIREHGYGPNSTVYEANSKSGERCILKVTDGLTKQEAIQYKEQFSEMDAAFSSVKDLVNIPKIYYHELKPLSTGKFQYFIIMEKAICSLKDIHVHRITKCKPWEEDELICLMHTLISFFCQIEDCKIYHKNLKETNILFGEDSRVIVADFVSSKKVNHENMIIGCTYNYMPEELLSHLHNFKVGYDPHKVEVYAIGMIFLKLGLMKNYLTFEGKQTLAYYLASMKNKMPRLHELWKSMLQPETRRLTLKELKSKLDDLVIKLPTKIPLKTDLNQFVHSSKKVHDWSERVKELFGICKVYELHKKTQMVIAKYIEAHNLMMKQEYLTTELIDRMAFCTREIGWLYLTSGDYTNALEYFTHKAEWLQSPNVKEIIGDRHVYHLYCLRDLAILHIRMDHYKVALDFNIQFLQGSRGILGENHQQCIDALEDMGIIYEKLGNLNMAVECYVTLLDKLKVVHGENHPDYIRILLKIVIMYEDIGDLMPCVKYKMEMSGKIKEVHGDISVEYLRSVADIAETYLKMKCYDQAIEFYNLVYLIQKGRKNGDNSEEALNTLESLAKLHRKTEEYTKSLQIELRVLDKKRNMWSIESGERFAKSWNNIAVTHELLGNFSKGYECVQKAFELYEKACGLNNPKTQACLRNLVKIAGRLNDGEAVRFYEKMLKKMD